ncbi:MAG: NADH dehydrogenase [Bryobacteraceae bacterium]|nr:MAG: NADH dehydrogenase [Bryobacteraceae bacterium]
MAHPMGMEKSGFEWDGERRARVVIVGGGFAGLYAARALGKAPVQVTLIDKRNFHLFQPLLYQVATGGLSPSDVASPLRRILRKQKNTRVLMGEMVGMDVARRRVILDNGWVEYDYLVLATGAENDYFGRNEWQDLAPGLKTIEDATAMRAHILAAFEGAERESDAEDRVHWLTFIVIGGGPTGVELAGALGEIARQTLSHDFRSIDPAQARILLVDAGERVLAGYPEELSAKAERHLIGLGVRTRSGLRVEEVTGDGVWVRRRDGEREWIGAKTVLWAAGVRASRAGEILRAEAGAELDRRGGVRVEGDLSIPGHPEIFVAGDLAHVEGEDGRQVPGVAPAAIQMGVFAAEAIQRRLRGEEAGRFRYRDKGSLAVIGRHAAVAWFGRLRFGGVWAWLAWLFIHILYLVGYQNRLLVLLQWALKYVTFNPRARLITGEAVEAPKAARVEG